MVATLAVVAVPTETAHHFWVSVYTGAARVNDALLHAQFPAPAARKEERGSPRGMHSEKRCTT